MQQRKEMRHPLYAAPLAKRALLGGGIGLVLIAVFLAGVRHPDPAWPAFWYMRPLIIVALAGAAGGLCAGFAARLGSRGGWRKVMAGTMGLVIYVTALWMGAVLGLDGTLWH